MTHFVKHCFFEFSFAEHEEIVRVSDEQSSKEDLFKENLKFQNMENINKSLNNLEVNIVNVSK